MRGGPLAKAKSAMKEARSREEKLAADREKAALAVFESRARLEEARTAEAAAYADEADLASVTRVRAKGEQAVREAEHDLARLDSFAPEVSRRVADAEAYLRVARRDALSEDACAARQAEREQAKALGAATRKALADADALAATRERAESIENELEQLDEEGLPMWPETGRDEGAWRPSGYERLVALLERGPLTPDADRAEQESRAARERANQEEQLLATVVRFLLATPAGFTASEHDELREAKLRQLPERLRSEALRREQAARETTGRPVPLGAA